MEVLERAWKRIKLTEMDQRAKGVKTTKGTAIPTIRQDPGKPGVGYFNVLLVNTAHIGGDVDTNQVIKQLFSYKKKLDSSKDVIPDDIKEICDEVLQLFSSMSITDVMQSATSSLEYFYDELVTTLDQKISRPNLETVEFVLTCCYYEFVLKGGTFEHGLPTNLLYKFLTLPENGNDELAHRYLLLSRLPLLSMRDRYKQYTADISTQKTEVLDRLNAVTAEVTTTCETLNKTDTNLKEYTEKAESLRSKLSFLILSEAFTNFIDSKEKNRKYLLYCLICLGILLIVTPITAFAIYHTPAPTGVKVSAAFAINSSSSSVSPRPNPSSKITSIEKHSVNTPVASIPTWPAIIDRLLNYLPLTVAELFLLFYFRIILHNYNSLNAQLLQLKMRQSVCQFIEDYVKFKKDKKADELEKFESLIFSNLMPSGDQIPPTFEGLDHLGKILGEFKPKKD